MLLILDLGGHLRNAMAPIDEHSVQISETTTTTTTTTTTMATTTVYF